MRTTADGFFWATMEFLVVLGITPRLVGTCPLTHTRTHIHSQTYEPGDITARLSKKAGVDSPQFTTCLPDRNRVVRAWCRPHRDAMPGLFHMI